MANEILRDQSETIKEGVIDTERVYQRPVTTDIIRTTFSLVSWGAVFAGTVMALVVHLTLSLLGLGIGLATIEPVTEANPLEGLGTGSVIWWSLSMIIALFSGGWVAARLAGIARGTHSVMHGLLTWGLFSLLTFFMLTTVIGRVIGGVGNVIGNTMMLAGQTIGPIDLSQITGEANALLGGGTGTTNGATGQAGFGQVINDLFRGGRETNEAGRETAVNIIVERTDLTREEAARMVDNWIVKFEQSKEDAEIWARETADKVAEATSKASIFAFFGLVLGALAAGFGGKFGQSKEMIEGRRGNGHL